MADTRLLMRQDHPLDGTVYFSLGPIYGTHAIITKQLKRPMTFHRVPRHNISRPPPNTWQKKKEPKEPTVPHCKTTRVGIAIKKVLCNTTSITWPEMEARVERQHPSSSIPHDNNVHHGQPRPETAFLLLPRKSRGDTPSRRRQQFRKKAKVGRRSTEA